MASSTTLLTEPDPENHSLVSDPSYQAPEIDLSEVTQVELIREAEASSVFRARWQGKDCILKIYRHQERTHAHSKDHEIDPYLRESRAYCRLKALGLCEEAYFLDFYGLTKDIDPNTEGWETNLKSFVEDPVRPNGVVMEYIPNAREFEPSHFSTARANQLRAAIAELHKAGVHHGDPYPRNVIVQGETDRAIWIDFDHADTFPLDSRTKRQEENMKSWMEMEDRLVHELLVSLAEDHKLGKIWWSWIFYYDTLDPPGWTKEDEEAKLKAILGPEKYLAYVEDQKRREEDTRERGRIAHEEAALWLPCTPPGKFDDSDNGNEYNKGGNYGKNDGEIEGESKRKSKAKQKAKSSAKSKRKSRARR